MYNIPRYQTGSYIPGLSSQIFGAGLGSDIRETQEDLYGKGGKLGERGLYDKIGGWLGGKGGKALAKWGMGALGVTNPWLKLAIPALGAAAGAYGLPKLFGGKDKKYKSKTGLLGSQYDKLSKFQDTLGEERKGRAVGYGLEGIYEGLKSDVGKELWGDVQSKYGWGEYGKAAEVDPSQALKNIGKLPSADMGAQLPEIGSFKDYDATSHELEDLARYGKARDLESLQAAESIGSGSEGLKFGRESGYQGYSPDMKSGAMSDRYNMISDVGLGGKDTSMQGWHPMERPYQPSWLTSPVESSGMPRRNLLGMIGSGTGHMGDLLTQFLSKQNINFGNAGEGQVWPRRYWQSGGPVGMQEGGSPEDSYKVDPDYDYVYINENEKDEKWYRDWIDLVAKENPKFLKGLDEPIDRWRFFDRYNEATESGEFPPDSLFNVYNPNFISPNPMFHPDTLEKRRLEQEELRKDIEENPEQWRDIGMQHGGMAYPLQMSGGQYSPEQGFGGLIQYRKGY
jgi:hypothetical protein